MEDADAEEIDKPVFDNLNVGVTGEPLADSPNAEEINKDTPNAK